MDPCYFQPSSFGFARGSLEGAADRLSKYAKKSKVILLKALRLSEPERYGTPDWARGLLPCSTNEEHQVFNKGTGQEMLMGQHRA